MKMPRWICSEKRQTWDETNHLSKQEIAELQQQVKDLGGYVGECKEVLAQQEIKVETKWL